MNEEQHIRTLLTLDPFTLTGDQGLPVERQNIIMDELQSVVLMDYFVNDVPNKVSEQQLNELVMLSEKGPMQAVNDKLMELIPTYNEEIFAKSVEVKKSYILKRIQQMKDKEEAKLGLLKSGNYPHPVENEMQEIMNVRKRIVGYTRALEAYQKDEWATGVQMLVGAGLVNLRKNEGNTAEQTPQQ